MKLATNIPGLRSPYAEVGGMVMFGRMLDKIRLHRDGKLPADWVVAKGLDRGFDGRCCRFLSVSYEELENETLKGGTDEEILDWAFNHGRRPSAEDLEVWNGFMRKLGWRDSSHERLLFRLHEAGRSPTAALTMFDYIELDEGRPPFEF